MPRICAWRERCEPGKRLVSFKLGEYRGCACRAVGNQAQVLCLHLLSFALTEIFFGNDSSAVENHSATRPRMPIKCPRSLYKRRSEAGRWVLSSRPGRAVLRHPGPNVRFKNMKFDCETDLLRNPI